MNDQGKRTLTTALILAGMTVAAAPVAAAPALAEDVKLVAEKASVAVAAPAALVRLWSLRLKA